MPKKTLRAHRIDHMLTYRGLANASGCAVTTLAAIERGARRPHFATMQAVARAMGVDVREIAEFDATLDSRISEAA